MVLHRTKEMQKQSRQPLTALFPTHLATIKTVTISCVNSSKIQLCINIMTFHMGKTCLETNWDLPLKTYYSIQWLLYWCSGWQISPHDKFTKERSSKQCGSGLLILRDGAISHNRPQIASDRTIHEKSHNSQQNTQFSQKKPLFNTLSRTILHLHVISRWFAFEKASKTFNNLLFRKWSKLKAFLGRPGTGTSFQFQRLPYWCNANDTFLCLGQSELQLYTDNIWFKQCLFRRKM